MKFPIVIVLSALALCSVGNSAAREVKKKERRVMTWVPPYAVEACRENLERSFDGVSVADGLTHLGLQFWQPTGQGGLELVDRFQPIDEATVAEFRKWGDATKVRIMLCVYNGTPDGWDWELAKSAFDTYREETIAALVSETMRLKLDGVDIDLEGKGNLDADQEAFVRFIRELSERLHAKGKELTVDTFAYKWHAPNQNWWAAILPHIDGLHVMGYSETGAGAEDWRSYDFVKAAAGDHASKLLIGVASHEAGWQNRPAREHLGWFRDDTAVGLAIWDAQLKDPVWRSKGVWETVQQIKEGVVQ